MSYETEFKIEMLSDSAAGEEALREFIGSLEKEEGWHVACWPDRFEVVTMEFPYSPGSEFETVEEWLHELKKAVPDVGYKGTFRVLSYLSDPPAKVFQKKFSHNTEVFKRMEMTKEEKERLFEKNQEAFFEACRKGDLTTARELFSYSNWIVVGPDEPDYENGVAMASVFSRLMLGDIESIMDPREARYYCSHVMRYGSEEDVSRIVLDTDLMSEEELSEDENAAMHARIILERYPDIEFSWEAIKLCGKVEDADSLRLAIEHSSFANEKLLAPDIAFLAENGLETELENRLTQKGKPKKATLQKAQREVEKSGNAAASKIIARLMEAHYGSAKAGSADGKATNADMELEKLRADWCLSRDEPGAVKYRGTDRNVVVPETIGKKVVTALADECFAVRCRDWSSAGLPKNRDAREDIETVYVADTVKTMGNYVFTGCGARELSIPPTLEIREINHRGDYGPFGNSNLETIHIRAKESSIPEELVENLRALFEGRILDQDGNSL